MNIDGIFEILNQHRVEYLLVGGVNFLLRHQPVMTFDVDIWIHDTEKNRSTCEKALMAMNAEWGRTEKDWGPVDKLPSGWLGLQKIFCVTTSFGALDIFRTLAGLSSWEVSAADAVESATTEGVKFKGLSDLDMLRSQEALPENERKIERLTYLRRVTDKVSQ